MHLDSVSHWCLWWTWPPLPSCLSRPLGRDGCPPTKGSRRKYMSALHLLLSRERNSQEFAETSTGCNALFTLLPKVWIPRHHLAGDGNTSYIPRLLEEINRVKVLRCWDTPEKWGPWGDQQQKAAARLILVSSHFKSWHANLYLAYIIWTFSYKPSSWLTQYITCQRSLNKPVSPISSRCSTNTPHLLCLPVFRSGREGNISKTCEGKEA